MGMTAYQELAHHYGDTHPYHTQQIYQNKGSPSVIAYLSRESPYISQTYGTAGSRQHYTQLTGEIISFLRHFHP